MNVTPELLEKAKKILKCQVSDDILKALLEKMPARM